jgi:hypothetical protein
MGEMLLAMVERKPLTATTVLRQPILQDGNTIGPAPR